MLLLEFPMDFKRVWNIEYWMKHLKVLLIATSLVLTIELSHLKFRFLVIRIDLQYTIVGDNSLTSLFAFLIEDAKVVPNLTAVWLNVLSLKNCSKRFMILVLEIEDGCKRDQISRVTWCLFNRFAKVFMSLGDTVDR